MKLGNNMNLNLFETHFKSLDRSQFIPDDFKYEANYDTPLPIGFNQTISQPSLVKQMILLLDPHPTDTVLEIGTGSGYLTALLSPFVQRIISLEIIPELARQANARLKNMGYHNIEVIISDGSFGYKKFAPYNRIIVSASSTCIPPELLEQLDNNGKMIIPIGNHYSQKLMLVEKDANGLITQNDLASVVFVEFVGPYGWNK
jgi:protein-L-isoaspartate(D-aspartate) O-methyltransferase